MSILERQIFDLLMKTMRQPARIHSKLSFGLVLLITSVWAPLASAQHGLSLSANAGSSTDITINFDDINGFDYITDAEILFNAGSSPSVMTFGSCYIMYSASTNSFYLANDASNGWLGPVSSDGSVQNSQCALSSTGTVASGSPLTLSITVRVNFSVSFVGTHYVFTSSTGSNGFTGFQNAGTHRWRGPA